MPTKNNKITLICKKSKKAHGRTLTNKTVNQCWERVLSRDESMLQWIPDHFSVSKELNRSFSTVVAEKLFYYCPWKKRKKWHWTRSERHRRQADRYLQITEAGGLWPCTRDSILERTVMMVEQPGVDADDSQHRTIRTPRVWKCEVRWCRWWVGNLCC